MSLKQATEYLIGMYPQENLFGRDICPKCGVSWVALQKDIETEPLTSRALDQALIIIENCDLCRMRFKTQLATIERLYQSRRLDKQGIEFKKSY